jgi:hypothetical protein
MISVVLQNDIIEHSNVCVRRIRAYRDATHNALSRYELPYIGEVADRWVGEE